jgi:hypothetical protein
MRRSWTTWRALSGSVPGSKISFDPGQPGDRLRADGVQPGHPVEQVLLEGDGDELLDLGRGQPEGLGLDLNPRRGELRQHVHRHVAQLGGPEHQQGRGQHDHDPAGPQAPPDDPTDHGRLPNVADHGGGSYTELFGV